MAKIYEHLIARRLANELDEKHCLSNLQFGFRKNKSTIDAMLEITKEVNKVTTRAYQHRGICILITVDIKNAFNSVNWEKLVQALHSYKIS